MSLSVYYSVPFLKKKRIIKHNVEIKQTQNLPNAEGNYDFFGGNH